MILDLVLVSFIAFLLGVIITMQRSANPIRKKGAKQVLPPEPPSPPPPPPKKK
ncbi:MAG: hypothetical protein L0Y56_05860 [Nitrospira sp.]|nr:hypothetical protein [Nitrospira sp.]